MLLLFLSEMTSEEQVQVGWCVTNQIWVGLLIVYAVTTEILLQLVLQAAQCVPVIVIFDLLVKMHISSYFS